MTGIKLEIKPFYVVLLLVSILTVLILRPFISTILLALVLSYISNPLYKWLNKMLRRKTIAALLTTVFVVLIIAVPAVFAINALSKEVFTGYLLAKQYLAAGSQTVNCDGNIACNLLKGLGFGEPAFSNFLSDSLGKVTATAFNKLTESVISFPKILANIFVAVFLMYYLLKDGGRMVTYAKSILPISPANQELLIKRFNEVTYAVVYGNVIVAIIQGVLTSIGFFLFGVPSPLIWGIVTMFTSLIPFLGAFVVWLPASLFLIFEGYLSGDGLTLFRGLGLMVYGLLFISSIDNILKPRLISDRANLHPALVLLGVIGGLSAIGITGIIIGPVIIAFAVSIIDMASRANLKES